jgi:hypothetical protein
MKSMKNSFFSTIKYVLLFFTVLLLTSCALKAIPSDYTFVKNDSEKLELSNLGNGKVLIYNGASILHKIDNTARLNVWIDDKALGQIRTGEYVVIDIEKGKHHFKSLHLDMVNMRSNDNIEIDENTKVIEIKPTITSNKLTIVNALPKNFEKYKYVTKR